MRLQHRRRGLEQRLVDDGGMTPWVALIAVDDDAAVMGVPEHIQEHTGRDHLSPKRPTCPGRPALGPYVLRLQLVAQAVHRPELDIAAEDVADDLRFRLVDDEGVVPDIVAEWRHAPHPHALL